MSKVYVTPGKTIDACVKVLRRKLTMDGVMNSLFMKQRNMSKRVRLETKRVYKHSLRKMLKYTQSKATNMPIKGEEVIVDKPIIAPEEIVSELASPILTSEIVTDILVDVNQTNIK